MKPHDKVILKDFLKTFFTEVKIIEADKHREKHIRNTSKTAIGTPQNERAIKEVRGNSIITSKEEKSKLMEPNPLEKQVLKKSQKGSNMSYYLKNFEQRKVESNRSYTIETQRIKNQLSKIEERIALAKNLHERNKIKQVMYTAHSIIPSELAVKKMKSENEEVFFNYPQEKFRKELEYIKIVKKIENSKLKRENYIKKVLANKEKRYNERKSTQMENYKKFQETNLRPKLSLKRFEAYDSKLFKVII